jgi:4-hydroxythreonine-4-phosphate dehydrogenase|tara:strand:+ start:629 stop:1657 length:1029 start_codon:yes stop_codon:yes gene_type:complete
MTNNNLIKKTVTLPIAVTMGEPAGIGGELMCLAWASNAQDLPPIVLIDDPLRIEQLGETIKCPVKVIAISKAIEAVEIWPEAIPVIPLSLNKPVIPGILDPSNSSAVIASLDKAIKLTVTGETKGLVTNPIHKSVLYGKKFKDPGHTEYLARATKANVNPVMMLVGPNLRVVPVTIHTSLSNAVKNLCIDDIVHCASLSADSLNRDFGIDQPRLAISALNPHAGENGAFGHEEISIIKPAIDIIKAKGINVKGPSAADTLFNPQARQNYDVVICMYHDQALIPIKMLDFHRSVNMTLGLPIVRTSPDHGTALDIAGTGQANPTSFIEAVKLASFISSKRENR